MKLTIEHLAAYLPYEVHLMNKYGNWHNTTLNKGISIYQMLDMKPILRPLSDLIKEIEHNGEKFVPIDWIEEKYYTLDLHRQCKRFLEEDGENWINQSDYMLVVHLIEWHFDIFGLIETGLAINYNELNK